MISSYQRMAVIRWFHCHCPGPVVIDMKLPTLCPQGRYHWWSLQTVTGKQNQSTIFLQAVRSLFLHSIWRDTTTLPHTCIGHFVRTRSTKNCKESPHHHYVGMPNHHRQANYPEMFLTRMSFYFTKLKLLQRPLSRGFLWSECVHLYRAHVSLIHNTWLHTSYSS